MSVPGSFFHLLGGKLKSIVNGPTTESLTIIGTAVDGPINRPIRVESAQQIGSIFGPAKYGKGYLDPNTNTETGKENGATLPLAVAQALSAGCTDIYVVRAGGNFAFLNLALGPGYVYNTANGYITFIAQNPGRIYNQVTISTQVLSTSGIAFTLGQPAVKGGNLSFNMPSGSTISDFIDAVNSHPQNKTVFAKRESAASVLDNLVYTLGTYSSLALSGGTNGCRARGEDFGSSVTNYATALTAADSGTFDKLLGQRHRSNVFALTGIYLDDQVTDGGSATSTSIAVDFVNFLDQMSAEVGPCRGVLGVRPPNIRDEDDLVSYINNSLLSTSTGYYNQTLRWIKAGPFLDQGFTRSDPQAGLIDAGFRLQVCALPEVVINHSDVGRYTSNFSVLYAALMTTIPPESSTTFKVLPGMIAYGTNPPYKYVKKLVEGLSFDATSDIAGNGAYVCLIRNPKDPRGPMIVFDDCTAAARDDYFRQDQLVHLCNNIHLDVDGVLSSFIGGPASPAALAAMDTQVQNVLDGYFKSGALVGGKNVGYEYKVYQQALDGALGQVRVDISIIPSNYIRKITITVQVRQQTQ